MISTDSIVTPSGMSLSHELALMKKYMEINANTPDYAIFELNYKLQTKVNQGAHDLPAYNLLLLKPTAEHRFKKGCVGIPSDHSYIEGLSQSSAMVFLEFTTETTWTSDLYIKTAAYNVGDINPETGNPTYAAQAATIRNLVMGRMRNTDGSAATAAASGANARFTGLCSMAIPFGKGDKIAFRAAVETPVKAQTADAEPTIAIDTRAYIIMGRGY